MTAWKVTIPWDAVGEKAWRIDVDDDRWVLLVGSMWQEVTNGVTADRFVPSFTLPLPLSWEPCPCAVS